jgi:hypothetical protein
MCVSLVQRLLVLACGIAFVALTSSRGDGEMAAWTAKWIWIDGTRGGGRGTREDELPRNFYLCARKAFDAPRDLQSATLRITADARYVLFVNGQRIGNGPIRGWQHSWFYDTYDLTPHLRMVFVSVIH